jgi:hypothetical protein
MVTPASGTGASTGCSIFVSYSHRDELLRQALLEHLALLQQQRLVAVWHDRRIAAGEEWPSHIDGQLSAADIVLLLVSPSFMASRHCRAELDIALQRQAAGKARVIPVLLRPVDWRTASFAQLQALPSNGVPVTSWSDRDAAFQDVVTGIRALVEASVATPDVTPEGTASPIASLLQRARPVRPQYVLRPLVAAAVFTLATAIFFARATHVAPLDAADIVVVFFAWIAVGAAGTWAISSLRGRR